MTEGSQGERWTYRGAFLGLAVMLIYIRLLPLGSGPGVLVGPDLMLCLVLVWVSRKREFVPLGLIVFVFLITDFLLMRPPGLWTALVVLGSEFMRTRTGRGVEMPFLLEWALASVTIATIIVIHRLVLLISAVPVPPLGTDLVFMTVTILAYPFVLAFSHYVFGVRRAAVREKSRP